MKSATIPCVRLDGLSELVLCLSPLCVLCVCARVCVCVRARMYAIQCNSIMIIKALLLCLHIRDVRVERDSVNSVTIDNEPQDKHERIMIAGHVGLNPSGNTMVLRCECINYIILSFTTIITALNRDTTLMPNIHGLSSLICLLFAPTVEMRYIAYIYLVWHRHVTQGTKGAMARQCKASACN